MTVYELATDGRFQSLRLVDGRDWVEVRESLAGVPCGASWRPVLAEVDRSTPWIKGLPESDFPALGGHPAFSQRAADALGDILQANGELLPLRCREGTYFLYNVTCLLEALDLERSRFERFPSGRMFVITRHEFIPAALAGATIFKLSEMPLGNVYVTDEFDRRVREAGLLGFQFARLWPSAGG